MDIQTSASGTNHDPSGLRMPTPEVAGGSAFGEWSRGWPVVLVSTIGLGIATSHVYTIGIFITPLEQAFGWSRAQISSGLMANSIISVIGAPFIGWLIDRFGTRSVGLPGVALYCISIALLSQTGASIWSWWGLWILVAFGAVLTKPTVWALSVSQRFDAQRALAIAIVMSGSGLCAIFLPAVTTTLISTLGWRGAFVGLGAGGALMALPLLYLFLRDGPDRPGTAPTSSTATEKAGLSIREGILSRRFLFIAICTVFMTGTIAGMSVHFVPFIISMGISKMTAASIAGVGGILSVVGRLGSGILLDRRWSGPLIGACSFTIPAIAGVVWLLHGDDVFSATVISGLLGLSLGAEMDVLAYLCSRYFGLKHYGVIYGTVAGLLALGVGVGPTLAGFAYDKTHSYDSFVWGAIPACLTAALLVGSLGRYPNFAARPKSHP
jgi:predicted MFS family arabinose efflux permease